MYNSNSMLELCSSFRGRLFWNELPNTIKLLGSFAKFRENVKSHLVDHIT